MPPLTLTPTRFVIEGDEGLDDNLIPYFYSRQVALKAPLVAHAGYPVAAAYHAPVAAAYHAPAVVAHSPYAVAHAPYASPYASYYH